MVKVMCIFLEIHEEFIEVPVNVPRHLFCRNCEGLKIRECGYPLIEIFLNKSDQDVTSSDGKQHTIVKDSWLKKKSNVTSLTLGRRTSGIVHRVAI
jgi:hypothetical protein